MNNSSNTDYVIEDFDNMEISTNNNATSNDTGTVNHNTSNWLQIPQERSLLSDVIGYKPGEVYLLNQSIQCSVIALIICVAIVSNTLVIHNIWRSELKMQTVNFLLIKNLCIVDLVGALVVLPVPLIATAKGQWDFGEYMCMINSVVNVALWFQHIVMFAMLKIDRVLASCLPYGKYPLLNIKIVIAIIFSTWIFSFFVASLVTAIFKSVYEPAVVLCIPELPIGFFITIFSVYCLALLGMVGGYIMVLICLKKKQAQIQNANAVQATDYKGLERAALTRKEIIHTLKKLGHDIINTSTTEIYWCTKTLLSCQKKNNVSLNYAISTSRRPLASSPITLELSPKRSHEDNENIAAVVTVHEDYEKEDTAVDVGHDDDSDVVTEIAKPRRTYGRSISRDITSVCHQHHSFCHQNKLLRQKSHDLLGGSTSKKVKQKLKRHSFSGNSQNLVEEKVANFDDGSQEIIFSGTASNTWLCRPAIYSFPTKTFLMKTSTTEDEDLKTDDKFTCTTSIESIAELTFNTTSPLPIQDESKLQKNGDETTTTSCANLKLVTQLEVFI